MAFQILEQIDYKTEYISIDNNFVAIISSSHPAISFDSTGTTYAYIFG